MGKENRFLLYIILMILILVVIVVVDRKLISDIFDLVIYLIIGTIFFLLLFPKQDPRWKLLEKTPMVLSYCKGCGTKFGVSRNMDFAGPTISENIRYRCENQPKWIARINGKKYFYCSDKCLSKDFARTKVTRTRKKFLNRKIKYETWRYTKYKKNPSKRFKLNLTKAYKLNNMVNLNGNQK